MPSYCWRSRGNVRAGRRRPARSRPASRCDPGGRRRRIAKPRGGPRAAPSARSRRARVIRGRALPCQGLYGSGAESSSARWRTPGLTHVPGRRDGRRPRLRRDRGERRAHQCVRATRGPRSGGTICGCPRRSRGGLRDRVVAESAPGASRRWRHRGRRASSRSNDRIDAIAADSTQVTKSADVEPALRYDATKGRRRGGLEMLRLPRLPTCCTRERKVWI